MTRLRLLLPFLTAAAAAASAPAAAQVLPVPPAPNLSKERAAYNADILRDYNALVARVQKAWEEKNADAAARSYSLGATLTFPGAAPVRGRQAIERETQRFFADGGTLLMSVVDFVASERLAYALGSYALQPMGPGEPATGMMAAVMIMESGRWKIHSHLFIPTPTAPQAPTPGS
jgi:uncharacterized protein (TIGR02246 family)